MNLSSLSKFELATQTPKPRHYYILNIIYILFEDLSKGRGVELRSRIFWGLRGYYSNFQTLVKISNIFFKNNRLAFEYVTQTHSNAA